MIAIDDCFVECDRKKRQQTIMLCLTVVVLSVPRLCRLNRDHRWSVNDRPQTAGARCVNVNHCQSRFFDVSQIILAWFMSEYISRKYLGLDDLHRLCCLVKFSCFFSVFFSLYNLIYCILIIW